MRIIVVTEKGLILAFNTEDIRTSSRGCKGVRAINLSEGDKVVSVILDNGNETTSPNETVKDE